MISVFLCKDSQNQIPQSQTDSLKNCSFLCPFGGQFVLLFHDPTQEWDTVLHQSLCRMKVHKHSMAPLLLLSEEKLHVSRHLSLLLSEGRRHEREHILKEAVQEGF